MAGLGRRRKLQSALAFAGLVATGSAWAASGRTVVSLTFDDGTADHALAGALLAERGFKGTFYVNSAQIGTSGYYLSLPELRAIASRGHEIGGHTLNHRDIAGLGEAERERQVCGDRDRLIAWGFSPSSFAYPYGSYDGAAQRTVRSCGYSNARIVGSITCSACPPAESQPPRDSYAVRTPPSIKATTSIEELKAYVEDAERTGGGWVVLVFHKVCRGCAENAVDPDVLAGFLDWLRPRAVFGTVVEPAGEAAGAPPAGGAAVGAIEPSGAEAGSPAITLTVYGSGFTQQSRVLWNGRTRVTSFVGPAELRARIPAADLEAPGHARVSVATPGGGTSAPASFTIHPSAAAPDKSASAEACRPYPNPWRGDAHAGLPVILAGFAAGSAVTLFTSAGRPLRTIPVARGRAVWDLTDGFGSRVGSGYFFYVGIDAGGRRRTGSLVILR